MDFSTPIAATTQKAIAEKTFPGCVIGIVTKSGNRQILPFGNFTYDADSPSVTNDTIYDTASITKSIPTGSLALQLIDAGKLHLEDRLIDYSPEFQNSDREHVRIKHLLTYGLDSYGFRSDDRNAYLNPQNHIEFVMTHDFGSAPGTVFKYSNIPLFLLGMVIERITGKTIDSIADEAFFVPLHMQRTTFTPDQFSKEEIVPTEIDDWRGLVHGVVHDESACIFKKEGRIVGHAGLFSTAPDILNFLEMLLNKGALNGTRYFSEAMVEQMGTNQIPELNDYTGLGFELNQPRYMGEYCTEHTFGKTGFTGTLIMCDIEKGIAYTILSNRIFPKRPADSSAINIFRKQIGEIILKG